MKRGDLVTIALSGDCGKHRPALVVQSDLFSEHPSVTILPVTRELCRAPLFRIEIEPTTENNLKKISQVMVDKIQTISCEKVGSNFGRLDDTAMHAINRVLMLWLGFA